MVGVTARAMRGEINVWKGALWMALLMLIGGRKSIRRSSRSTSFSSRSYVVVALTLSPQPLAMFKRAIPFAVASGVAALLINLYWIVPFVDYFRHVW